MATNDLTLFNKAKQEILKGTHNLLTDAIKVYFTGATPTAADANPVKTTYAELSGGTFVAGGETMTVAVNEAAGVAEVVFSTNISNAANAGNPTGIKYAVIYNDTAASKNCLAFVELSTAGIDATTVDLGLNWGAKIFSIS